MAGYSDLLRTPGVARIIIAQLVARFPSGMASLAILMHIEQVTGSYGAAGLVLAATSIGQGIAGPVTSRWMGKWGTRRVLSATVALCALSVGSITFLHLLVPASTLTPQGDQLLPSIVWVYMALGALAGLSTPPIQSAVRTIYPKMVNGKQLTPLFSLDASLQEIIWIIAPVLVTFVVTGISSMAGLILIMIIQVGGGTWFIVLPEVGRVRIPPSRRSLGKVLTKAPVVLATVLGFLLIAACSAVEASVVATFGHDESGGHGGPEAGLVLAVFSVGSLIGGLASGSFGISQWSMAKRMSIVAVGLSVIPFLVHPEWAGQPWAIGAALTVAGLGIAPALAVLFAMTSASVKFSETAEAFGWLATGQLIGAAAGSSIAGFLIDGVGPAGAYAAAAGFAIAAAIVAFVFVPKFPDLRGRDSSPIPDTGMITAVTAMP